MKISERFGVSVGALHRHRQVCIGNDAKRAAAEVLEARRIRSGADILRELEELQRKTLSVLNSATDGRTQLAAIGEARRNLALFAELLGELRRGPAVNVGVSVGLHTSVEWIALRAALLKELRAFPEARAAVAARLAAGSAA